MNKLTLIHQHRTTMLSASLVLLMIGGLLAVLAPTAAAAVHLLYFKGTPNGSAILL